MLGTLIQKKEKTGNQARTWMAGSNFGPGRVKIRNLPTSAGEELESGQLLADRKGSSRRCPNPSLRRAEVLSGPELVGPPRDGSNDRKRVA